MEFPKKLPLHLHISLKLGLMRSMVILRKRSFFATWTGKESSSRMCDPVSPWPLQVPSTKLRKQHCHHHSNTNVKPDNLEKSLTLILAYLLPMASKGKRLVAENLKFCMNPAIAGEFAAKNLELGLP